MKTMISVLLVLIFVTAAMGGEYSTPNTFEANTTAVAAEVNTNFSAAETAINDNHQRIGSLETRITNEIDPDLSEVKTTVSDLLTAQEENELQIAAIAAMFEKFFRGDGSGGDLVVSSNQNWEVNPPGNPNFATVTIDAGATLRVPAGMTIRTTGDFINNGTILVGRINRASGSYGVEGGSQGLVMGSLAGDSGSLAASGQYHYNSVDDPKRLLPGSGGRGIPTSRAISSWHSFRMGGGSGAGVFPAAGGGLLKVYSTGSIINDGSIEAEGEQGAFSGGGGGGIVILASTLGVQNNGTISVAGGDGNATSIGFGLGAGGGGGGGIAVLVSPDITAGTVDVSGGLAGQTSGTDFTTLSQVAGGGGGGAGGDGGSGQLVNSGSPSSSGAQDGREGYLVELTTNPMFMLQ